MASVPFSSSNLTRLLVSIRDAAEAKLAMEAGVDLIDVKDPSRGSLGDASRKTLFEIRDVVGNALPCSAACGELVDGMRTSPTDTAFLRDTRLDDTVNMHAFLAQEPPEFVPIVPPRGYAYAKIGLSKCSHIDRWKYLYQSWMKSLPEGCQAVAVCYADAVPAEAPEWALVMREARKLGCTAVLLDTFDKQRGGLLDQWTLGEVAAFIAAARTSEMQSAISGSLDLGSIPSLLELNPDIIAVRGAICVGDRTTSIDRNRLLSLVGLIKANDSVAT